MYWVCSAHLQNSRVRKILNICEKTIKNTWRTGLRSGTDWVERDKLAIPGARVCTGEVSSRQVVRIWEWDEEKKLRSREKYECWSKSIRGNFALDFKACRKSMNKRESYKTIVLLAMFGPLLSCGFGSNTPIKMAPFCPTTGVETLIFTGKAWTSSVSWATNPCLKYTPILHWII